MQYVILTNQDQVALRKNRLRELEMAHFQFCLEDQEESKKDQARTAAIADLERRISEYHAALEVIAGMAGDSPESEADRLAQP